MATHFQLRKTLAGVLALATIQCAPSVHADGMPSDAAAAGNGPSNAAHDGSRGIRSKSQTLAKPKRDPLKVDPEISVRSESPKAVDLPGVMHLEGESQAMLDPTRARMVSCRSRGAVTVWVSDHHVNRIQLPFANPRVIATDVLTINKRAASNNVYVSFAGEPAADQVWFEPPGESAVSCGLQLVPKDIPAQDIVVLDDTVESTATRTRRAGSENEYLTRVQALMEQAALGASPVGFSEAELQAPAMSVNGLAVKGLRRLSSRTEDLYVYEITNAGTAEREVREEEFDGAGVLAVSILPRPLLRPSERAVLVILAAKREEK
jgi:conjugal transfer pilus assembly protein TraK